jgi:hypothetical protein
VESTCEGDVTCSTLLGSYLDFFFLLTLKIVTGGHGWAWSAMAMAMATAVAMAVAVAVAMTVALIVVVAMAVTVVMAGPVLLLKIIFRAAREAMLNVWAARAYMLKKKKSLCVGNLIFSVCS